MRGGAPVEPSGQTQIRGSGGKRRKKLDEEAAAQDEAGSAEEYYRSALLFALGPLHLTFDDLWRITAGEFYDLSAAWRYNEYLESRKRAQLACCILSGLVARPPDVQDIAGIWDDKTMRVYGKMEMYELIKERIIKNRNR